MITHVMGDILQSEADALVNPVNCVGTMGKGLALAFQEAYPRYYKHYLRACAAKAIQPGQINVYTTRFFTPPHYLISFPTKRHWRDKGSLVWVESGMQSLVGWATTHKVKSVSVPALGTGLAQLPYKDVDAIMVKACANADHITWYLYKPLEEGVYGTATEIDYDEAD